MMGGLRPRTRRGRLVLAACGLAAGIVSVWGIRLALRPAVYYISTNSLKDYRAHHVPDAVLERLESINGKAFTRHEAVLDDVRTLVGDEAYRAHGATIARYVRSKPCWPNASTRRVHAPQDSRTHPAYGRFGAELIVPQSQLPPILTQFDFLPGSGGLLVLGKLGHLIWLGPDFWPRAALQLPDVYPGGDDQGALGLALDPDFAVNRFVYVAFVDAPGTSNVIVRLTLRGDADAILKSRAPVIRFPKENREQFHGIAGMRFDRAGVLLVQVGDPTDHAQRWRNPQGKLLGILPGHGPQGGYAAAAAPRWCNEIAFS